MNKKQLTFKTVALHTAKYMACIVSAGIAAYNLYKAVKQIEAIENEGKTIVDSRYDYNNEYDDDEF